MKKKIALVMIVVMMVLFFTGCEQQIPITEILSTVKGYSEEILAMVASEVETSLPDSFTDDTLIAIDTGISCRVSNTYTNELILDITLNNWVASDGTVISGSIEMDLVYDADSTYIYSIQSIVLMNYDLTSVYFGEEVFDNTPETAAFTFDNATFQCLALSVDGKPLISNQLWLSLLTRK
ncbi:hypothetical protein SpiGrapes_1323 [Sphaerochaeta pleomorpha str. Grapes]|uniref:Uncharacterized protein n=1 Tax=Sphaerochaeta pleomorpha (strain ATCC BAA-1885 / DSM 22778 / Grapes) TaxID=158190 RepID=G8QTW0_SPHPG|nr:hypothetical protein [Sphaerochaeta pleomorpha]AEV29136.1 hypothetical protein SpiGrapes_1323 [Sphaerochaeta pleomorpha str. Grapes]